MKTSQAEAMALVESIGGHVILLDELCRITKRYLEEHPHLDISDLRQTFDIFHRLTTALASHGSSS
jgi:hypothetical protein